MNDSGKGAGANSIPGINYSCVKEFTDIFEQQYDNLLAMGMLSEDSQKLEKYLNQFVSQGEYNHKEDQPFSKLLLTNLLDLTIIKPIVESCCGYDLITKEDLTDMERSLKLVFAIVDLVTLATGLYGFTLAAETMGAKEAVAYFARLAMVELAADVSATTVATIGEYCEWPAGLTILLSLGTGLTVGQVGNHLIFKQNGIEIFSKEVSGDRGSHNSSFDKLNVNTNDVVLPDGTWELGQAPRGNIIDDMYNNTGKYYPTVDIFDEGTGMVTSVKSRDLSLDTYQNGTKLKNTIVNDVNALLKFDGATYDGYSIFSHEIKSKKLKIVVPDVVLTKTQIDAINSAIDYATQKNVIIEIVVGR